MSLADSMSSKSIAPLRKERVDHQFAPNSRVLADMIASLGVDNDWNWAWENYKPTIRNLCKRLNAKRVIEIGGGRNPSFALTELNELGAEFTVNDIERSELEHLPAGYRTASFDIAGDLSHLGSLRGSFDLAFSQMVFEHVSDGQRAWANVYGLLAPGGIALAFVPTLYAFPFVLNWLLPSRVAATLVRTFRPDRDYDVRPVFPAHYSWCISDEKRMTAMLSAIGFREAAVVPFYGHSYYAMFPIMRDLHSKFNDIVRRHDWRTLASFAYIIVRK